jgi:two-component system cell cycle sensor histidine kinase/response regulator CckA
MSKPNVPAGRNPHEVSEQSLGGTLDLISGLMHSTPHAVVGWDLDGKVTLWNPAAEAVFGWMEAEVLGRPGPIVSDEAIAEAVSHSEVLAGIEVRRVRKDGSPVDLQVHATHVKGKNGEIVGTVAAFCDITSLRQAEEEIRNLFEIPQRNPNPSMRVSTGGILLYANPASAPICAAWNCKVGSLVPDSVQKTILEVLADGDHKETLVELGDAAWSVMFISSGEGNVNLYGRNVTECKRFERALLHTNEMLSTLVNSSPLVVTMLDCDGKVVLWNSAAESTFGWTEAEVLHRRLPIIQKAAEEEFEANFASVWRGETLRDVEVKRLRKNGSLVDLRLQLAPVRGRRGEVTGAMAILQDITERKKAEEALRQTNEELSALINCSPLPINTLDCNGNVTLWNPAAEAVFGWSEAEVLGRFLPIVPAEAKDEFLGYLSTVLAGETLKGQEIRRMRKDGSIAELRVWGAPLRDRDGKAIGCMSVLDDMTERKQLKAQLRQSQRMEAVGRLAGGIAHEFKNLLMGISSYAEMLQMKLGPDHPEFETANELLQCVDRAARLAGQLQTFGRRQSLEIRPTDLNVLVSESEHFLEHLLGEHIEMTLDLSGEPAIADVDSGQIEQVLTNLAINARDAMPQGGQLAIRTRVTRIDDPSIRQSHDLNQDRYVEISVTDTGSGMSEDIANQIFEPFFTTKGSDGRMGLGLSVTYGIVKQHKGSIEVKSEAGEGSTFLVYLPAAEHASVPDEEQATRQPKSGTETILLAEDEDIVRMPVTSLLEAYGYTVLAAGDGEEAIKLFERHVGEIDLAVLDLVMPRAGGKHVWQAIREAKPDAKVLFISGHTAAAHEDFMPPSDLPVLPKPFSVLNLADKIREILD